MAWIDRIDEADADGKLAELYEAASRGLPGVPNIIKVGSLNPDALENWLGLFAQLMFGDSALSRAQREMIAVRVSVLNECHY